MSLVEINNNFYMQILCLSLVSSDHEAATAFFPRLLYPQISRTKKYNAEDVQQENRLYCALTQ